MASELTYRLDVDLPEFDLRAGDYVVVMPGQDVELIVRRELPLEVLLEIRNSLTVIHVDPSSSVDDASAVSALLPGGGLRLVK